MTTDLRSARSLSPGERAELNNAAFADYFVPHHMDEAAVLAMTKWYDLDPDAGRIAYRDGSPVGLANIGVRGDEAWIGGTGVIPSARHSSIAHALMEAVHEQARVRGVKRIWLEVIVENTGALALYEKLGYRTVQDVEVWTLAGVEGTPEGHEVPLAEAKALIGDGHEPWQRADQTIANNDDVRGWVTGTGAMLFAARASAQLQQYSGEPRPLIEALRTFGNVFVLNLPATDPAAAVLRELGGTVTVRQHEMVLEL